MKIHTYICTFDINRFHYFFLISLHNYGNNNNLNANTAMLGVAFALFGCNLHSWSARPISGMFTERKNKNEGDESETFILFVAKWNPFSHIRTNHSHSIAHKVDQHSTLHTFPHCEKHWESSASQSMLIHSPAAKSVPNGRLKAANLPNRMT